MESKFNIVYYALNDSIRRPLRQHTDKIAQVLKKPNLGERIYRQVLREGFEHYRDFYKAIFQEEAPLKLVTGTATYAGMNAILVMLHRTKVLSQVTSHPQCEDLEQVHIDGLTRIANRIHRQLEDGNEYQFHASDESDGEDEDDEDDEDNEENEEDEENKEKTQEDSTSDKDEIHEEAEELKKETKISQDNCL